MKNKFESVNFDDWEKRCIASGRLRAPKIEFPVYALPFYALLEAIFNGQAQKKYLSAKNKLRFELKEKRLREQKTAMYIKNRKKEFTPPPGYVPVWKNEPQNPYLILAEKIRMEKEENKKC